MTAIALQSDGDGTRLPRRGGGGESPRTLRSPNSARLQRARSHESSVTTSPMQATFSDANMHAQEGPGTQHFSFAPKNVGAVASSASAKPRPKRQASAPAFSQKRDSISVDELVGRLYHAQDTYDQKRTARQEQKAKADNCYTHQPSLNRRSLVLSSGVEPLEMRMSKITQQRDAKLEKARARKEEVVEKELAESRPIITAKGSKIRRNYEALQRWDEQRNQKIMQRQHQRYEERLQECTFQPNVSPGSKRIVSTRRVGGNIFNDKHHVHNRLHQDANRRQVEKAENIIYNAGGPEGQSMAALASARRRPGHSDPIVNGVPSQATPTAAPRSASMPINSKRAAAPRSAGASGWGAPSANGGDGRPLSFEAFMRTLACENPNTYSSQAGADAAENELDADSIFLGDRRSRSEVKALRTGGFGRSGTAGTAAMMSDAEDEIFMAEAPPRPSPYPSPHPDMHQARSQSPRSQHQTSDYFDEDVLPEWVKFAMPSQAAVAFGIAAPSTPRSQNATPRYLKEAYRSSPTAWSIAARSNASSPVTSSFPSGVGKQNANGNPNQNDQNTMTYSNAFDDVFRIGFGGALPGTMA